MAPKINAKNLSYDNSAPPFLAALRAQAAGNTGPSELLAAQRRSAKKRSSSEEAEDAPLVVDEDGNVVKVEVDKDGTVTDRNVQADADADAAGDANNAKREPDGKASIGGRKRKVGRVIGESAEEEKDGKKGDKDTAKESPKETSNERKPKKKAKKIKLSFDEDD